MTRPAASDLHEILAGRHRVALLAPHPDDESLACGGLLARAFAGPGAHVICLTDGSASHPGSTTWPGPRLAALRRAELICAIGHLGGSETDLTWLGLKDGALSSEDPAALAARLDAILARQGIRHVLAPAPQDHHADHKATARLAVHLRARRPDWRFYCYPVWSRWDEPDFARMIAGLGPETLDPDPMRARKRAAIEAHRSQLGQVVTDDPGGFVLPSQMVATFLAEHEIFWRMP